MRRFVHCPTLGGARLITFRVLFAIRTTSQAAAPERERVRGYISKTPSMAVLQPFSKALSLCSACNDRYVISEILRSKTRHTVLAGRCMRKNGDNAENTSDS